MGTRSCERWQHYSKEKKGKRRHEQESKSKLNQSTKDAQTAKTEKNTED